MNLFRTLAITGVLSVAFLGVGTSKAQAQYLNINVPGFSMSLGGGYPGYYGVYAPGVSVVAPSPVVVGSTYPVYAPYYVPRTYVVPQTYYYGAPYVSTGWYRPYRYGWW
jgi:hypothetical protein